MKNKEIKTETKNILFLDLCGNIIDCNCNYKKRIITWMKAKDVNVSSFEKVFYESSIKSESIDSLFFNIESLIDNNTIAIIDDNFIYFKYNEEFKQKLIELVNKRKLKLFLYVPCMYLRTIRNRYMTNQYNELKKQLKNKVLIFKDDWEGLNQKYKEIEEKIKANEKNYIDFVLENIKE